jgi:uncharacterized protein YndB with AHSA1/START domain
VRFDAAPEAVFDAWLEPALIRRWFGPGLGEVTTVAVDARVGGAFSIVQQRGETDVDHVGVYLELLRPTRLAFTWAVAPSTDASRVLIDVQALEQGCEVTLEHEMDARWAEFVPRAEAAWRGMLEAMRLSLVR